MQSDTSSNSTEPSLLLDDKPHQFNAHAMWVILVSAIFAFGFLSVLRWIESKRACSTHELSQPPSSSTSEPSASQRRLLQRDLRRRASIDANMKVHQWRSGGNNDALYDEESALSMRTAASSGDGHDASEQTSLDYLRSTSALCPPARDDPTTPSFADSCVICLSSFKTNDLVCESNQRDCIHLFHAACMKEWLLTNNHCPVCRVRYLDCEA
jgi:Ring finger domain